MITRFLPFICSVVLVACSSTGRITTDEGKPVAIDPAKPPSGAHMVQILLNGQLIPLKGTHCEGSWTSDDKRRLQHWLAMALGGGLENPDRQVTLVGGCEADQLERRSGKIIDGWRCNFNVVENNEKGEHIANSSIYFGITKDTWELIPETMACL